MSPTRTTKKTSLNRPSVAAVQPAPATEAPIAPHTLHYNKAALLADYQDTFNFFMKVLLIGIGGALAYFFVVIIYLGARGHTKSEPYTKVFEERYPYQYSGLKLPMFGGPAHPVERHAAAPEAAHRE